MKVAAIGECMVEFSPRPGGGYIQSFGGDTLNFAVYLARLGAAVDYVTALGDDPFSAEMLAAWRAEGVGTDLVDIAPGRMPGLYVIRTDADGERSFHYWRDRAPARELFARAHASGLAERLAGYDWLYLSGITLSIYGRDGRAVLFEVLDAARRHGGRVAFDGNYRPRGWNEDAAAARGAFAEILRRADLALPTFDDEHALFGDRDAEACASRHRAAGIGEVVVKQGERGCLVGTGDDAVWVPTERVAAPVDTTAAGDSFNAGYLAARLGGADAPAAARQGHRLAATVIRYPGAVIPRDAMPDMVPAPPTSEGTTR
ncbi:MAG: sugar kinase [Alphaproteobacteria bacterium]